MCVGSFEVVTISNLEAKCISVRIIHKCILFFFTSYSLQKCRSCKKKGDERKLLICDICDTGYHCGCLRPPLKKVSSSISKLTNDTFLGQ